jgi:uncharacterized membrane protein
VIIEEEITQEVRVDEEELPEKIVQEEIEEEPARRGGDFELDIGRKWFNKIGIASIVIGVAFFIKYSLELGMLGPIGKIIIGMLIGIGLLVSGEIFDRKKEYIYLARSLTGGSFAVLYITVFAAHNQYKLISIYQDILILGIIVLLGVIFSLKYESKIIASEAFLLGYLISFMDRITGFTLLYSLILTFGLIIVARRHNWNFLVVGGLGAAHITHLAFRVNSSNFMESGGFLIAAFLILAYYVRGAEDREISEQITLVGLLATYIGYQRFPLLADYFYSTFFFLIAFFLLFNILPFVRGALKEERKLGFYGIITLLLNALFFYGKSYEKLETSAYLGLFTLGVAGLFLVLTYLASKQGLDTLFSAFFALCITFITVTIPVQVSEELITVFWAIEALALLATGFKFSVRNLRYLGSGVAIVTMIKTVFIDTGLSSFDMSNLLASTRFLAFLFPIVTFYASYWIYRRNVGKTDAIEKDVMRAYPVAASLLVALLMVLELDGWKVTAGWAVLGLCLSAAGFGFTIKELRSFSSTLGVPIIFKVLLIDSQMPSTERIYAFIFPIATFYVISILYNRHRDAVDDFERKKGNYSMIGATLLVSIILALELRGGYISAAWAIQAIVLLILGFHYKHLPSRMLGLALLGATTIKVFIFDTSSLESIYRVLSFTVLGVIFILASYAYTRYRYIFEEDENSGAGK